MVSFLAKMASFYANIGPVHNCPGWFYNPVHPWFLEVFSLIENVRAGISNCCVIGKVARLVQLDCRRSAAYRLYRVRAMILLWDMPVFIGWILESSSTHHFTKILFVKNNFRVRYRGDGRKRCLNRSLLCWTLSNTSVIFRVIFTKKMVRFLLGSYAFAECFVVITH